MIKKYNQFVKGKVNEDYELEMEAPVRTLPSLGNTTKPVVKPDTTERPAPTRPTPFPTKRPSTEPGTKAEFEGEEEEVDVDKYEMALQQLADLAGVEFNTGDKVVVIDGKEISFPAETEKYHVKGVKKSFSTPEDVLSNLGGQVSATDKKQEVSDEMSSIKDEEVLDTAEHFESKSYKYKRYKK